MTSKRIVAGILVIIVLVGGVWFWKSKKAAKAAAAQDPIETAKVERKDLTITVSASGVLEALTTVEVKSRSGGEVKGMYVEAGDYVNAGDMIALLDPTELQNKADQASASVTSSRASQAQARLNAQLSKVQTSTSLTQADANVASAQASVRQAEEQFAVEKQTTSDAVKQAEASLKSAEARLQQAKLESSAQKPIYEADLASSKASVESARQNLQKLQAGPRAEEIARAKASMRSAEAGLDNAEAFYKRQKALLAKGFVSAQDVDDANKAYQQALATRDSARETLAEAQAGNRPEDIKQAQAQLAQAEANLQQTEANRIQIDVKQHDVRTAEASVAEAKASLASVQAQQRNVKVREQQLVAARASLRQAAAALTEAKAGKLETRVKEHQVEVAMADLQKNMVVLNDAQYNLQYAHVTAPRSGVVMEKLVEEGSVVPAGTAALKEGTGLVTIADISQMYVLVDVDEVDITPVAAGQSVDISVSSLSDEKLKGEVVKIFPQGVEESNVVRFQVKVKIDNPPKTLRPGMTADVTITVAERKDILVVPDTCITRENGKTTVQVIKGGDKEQTTEVREVKVGLSDWDNTEIISGLKEGEELVVPPPPGTELPRWMQSSSKKDASGKSQTTDRQKSQMLRGLGGR